MNTLRTLAISAGITVAAMLPVSPARADQACPDGVCPTGETCAQGYCVALPAGDPCWVATCKSWQVCVRGLCQDNACARCQPGETCDFDHCIKDTSCAAACSGDTVCRDRQCVPNPCTGIVCPFGQVCPAKGGCVDDPYCIGVTCDKGRVCDAGRCVVDTCIGTTCGKGKTCKRGHCVGPVPTLDPCAHVLCPTHQKCRQGKCIKERPQLATCENVQCPAGEICFEGRCIAPPK